MNELNILHLHCEIKQEVELLTITIMKRENTEIWVILKGDFYAINTYCHTLKEAIEDCDIIGGKRSNIADWWKKEIK